MKVSLGDRKVLNQLGDKDMTIWLKLINAWNEKDMWKSQNSWKFEKKNKKEGEREKEPILVRLRERKGFNWFKSHFFH